MQTIKHVVESEYKQTYRTAAICGKFDLSPNKILRKEWYVEIDLPEDWKIGLITGGSGSGKTTISKAIFGEHKNEHQWCSPCFLDDFSRDCGIDEIIKALTMTGFSSPPCWLLPYSALSNGQKFRADLARAILESSGIIVYDEFTSVVDRNVAKASSNAVQKYIRRANKQFVAVSCHRDIEEWLMPDWVLDMDVREFYRRSLQRPKIQLEIKQCHLSAWRLFKDHHYLTEEIHKAATAYVGFINDVPVAFTSLIWFPNKKGKADRRLHRTVVLPDYQGLGLARAIVSAVCDDELKKGHRIYTSTSHPAMIASRTKDKSWRATTRISRQKPYGVKIRAKNTLKTRLVASFEYVGEHSLR